MTYCVSRGTLSNCSLPH